MAIRFDVALVLHLRRALLRAEPDPVPIQPDPPTQGHLAWLAYQAKNARFHAARGVPGFQGYSLRPGKDIVVNGEHVTYREVM